jgi:hypothetical protein
MAEAGRPTVMTDEILRKLEEVFALGATDQEAIFYAGISKTAFYDYCKEHPEFAERKEDLKEQPILKARRTVVANLDKPDMALKYLERKKKKEFSPSLEVDATVNLGPAAIKLNE